MTPAHIGAYKIDRTGWDPGPWDGEPDRVDFRHAGFACLLLRNHHGAWCGYVGVPPGHPDHGQPYDLLDVDCHGGLTYSDKCDDQHICHVSAPGEPEPLWWFGFDCGHFRDLMPGMVFTLRRIGITHDVHDMEETYRDLAYARAEVEQLAEQFKRRAR